MDPILQKFRNKFIEEAQSLLDNLEKNLLEIENKPDEKELTESAFRAMHTLKGISSMYGFDFISEFTHHLESIWQGIRDEQMQFNKEVFNITFNSIDHIRKLLDDEKLENPENKINHKNLLDTVIRINNLDSSLKTKVKEKPVKASHETTSWHILLKITEKLFFRGISLKNIIGELIALGEYEIFKMESLCDAETDVWSIIFTSDATEDEIREIFLFIEDDCTLVNLSKGNILSNLKIEEDIPESKEHKLSLLEYAEDLSHRNTKPADIDENNKLLEHANQVRQTVKRISVDASKLDQLMFLVSELITVNSQLNLTARKGDMEQMTPHLEKIDTLSKQFRNNALEIRLVPLSDTVLRFRRLIRDLSIQLGKKVEFRTSGTETELDKNTIDQLAEPLMHIIRNCIDHGIETPENRVKSGKPEQGTINLTAYNSGSFVFICISDDGNGIDFEKVKQKAVEKGILKSTDNPTNKDIYDFIFLPGFSTARSLTSISGRGVGMDVVKKRINDLRGEVIVSSDTGIGTTFTLKIQQSLSIIDTLLFTVDDHYFTVPISEIEVCMQLSTSEIKEHKNTSTIRFNDHLIPFIDLRYLFKMDENKLDVTKAIIIKNENKELALLSDKIIGEHQAVLKPLGKSFQDQKYITSASQLGDGNMAFMIDTNVLLKQANY
jgi:two-component system, chemotaxis family, sensor kinase CheA